MLQQCEPGVRVYSAWVYVDPVKGSLVDPEYKACQ
jgi:hypothetical protein